MPSQTASNPPPGKLVAMKRRSFLAMAGAVAATACSSGTDLATSVATTEPEPGLVVAPVDDGVAVTDPATAVEPAAAEPTAAVSETGLGTDGARVLDMPITYVDGTTGTLTDLHGTPTVINFFASWCPPCREELPDFQESFAGHNGEVAFYGVLTNDEIEPGMELIAETGVTFPILVDQDQELFFSSGGIAMPTTIFMNSDGTLANTWFGPLRKQDLDAMIEELT